MPNNRRLLFLLLQIILIHSKTEAQRNKWAGSGGRLSRYSSRYTSQDSMSFGRPSSMTPGRGQPMVDHGGYRQYPESRVIISNPGRSQYRNGDPYLDTNRRGRYGASGSRQDILRNNMRNDMRMGGSMPRYSSLGLQNERGMYMDPMMDGRYQQNPRFDSGAGRIMDPYGPHPADHASMGHYQNGRMSHRSGVMHQHQQLNPFTSATGSNLHSSGTMQQPGMIQSMIHNQPSNLAPGGTTSILPLVIQQTPQVLPVPVPVNMPTNPLQSMVQSLTNAGGQSQGFGLGGGGFGSNLNTLSSLFSSMSPIIIKMEDMPSQTQQNHMNPFGSRSSSPLGPGAMDHHNPSGDPRISVVKLDEGLDIVINYTDPHGTIMNLPSPSNEEEANVLMRVLERAEAPEYIKSMVRIRPRPNPAAVAAVAAAKTAAVANAVNAAAAAGAAMAAAATAPIVPSVPIVTNTAAVVPAAVASPAVVAGPPVVAVAAPAVAAPAMPAAVVPAGASGGVTVPGGVGGTAESYDDIPIDEIIAGAFVGVGAHAPVGGVAAGANYPMDHSINNGRFMLTSLDMELTPAQYAELQSPVRVGRKKRKALVNSRSRWPGGIVPYEIDPMAFNQMEIQLIQEAMNKWSASTCIRFRQATAADPNTLVFRQGKGCSSNVGMIGGRQFLTLQKECRIPKILAHEIGHALGLIHEHQRQDRDNFLKINYHNIKPGTNKDFDIFKLGSVEHSYANYDYMSIMHYGKTQMGSWTSHRDFLGTSGKYFAIDQCSIQMAFAREKNLITMEAVDTRYTNLMGRATNLSPSDWGTVNAMYGCGDLSGSMAGAAMMAGTPIITSGAMAPVQTAMAPPAVIAPSAALAPAPAVGAVLPPNPVIPAAPASATIVQVAPPAVNQVVPAPAVGGVVSVVPAAPVAGGIVQTVVAPPVAVPGGLAPPAVAVPAPATATGTKITLVVPATGAVTTGSAGNKIVVTENSNNRVLIAPQSVGGGAGGSVVGVGGAAVGATAGVSNVGGGSNIGGGAPLVVAEVGGVAGGVTGNAGQTSSVIGVPSQKVVIKSGLTVPAQQTGDVQEQRVVVVGDATNLRERGVEAAAVGEANGSGGKNIATKVTSLNKRVSTDLCAGFTKYCQVDHDLVYSVLGPQILAKCGHMCLKTQRG